MGVFSLTAFSLPLYAAMMRCFCVFLCHFSELLSDW